MRNSLCAALWKLDMNQNQHTLCQGSTVQRILASTKGLSCVGNWEDLISLPDISWWMSTSTVVTKWGEDFGWVVLFQEVCGCNGFYSWGAGPGLIDLCNPLTWEAASTLLQSSLPTIITIPQSHFFLQIWIQCFDLIITSIPFCLAHLNELAV